jgi:hypothetical protein
MRCWATHLLGIAVSGAVALPDMAQQAKTFRNRCPIAREITIDEGVRWPP